MFKWLAILPFDYWIITVTPLLLFVPSTQTFDRNSLPPLNLSSDRHCQLPPSLLPGAAFSSASASAFFLWSAVIHNFRCGCSIDPVNQLIPKVVYICTVNGMWACWSCFRTRLLSSFYFSLSPTTLTISRKSQAASSLSLHTRSPFFRYKNKANNMSSSSSVPHSKSNRSLDMRTDGERLKGRGGGRGGGSKDKIDALGRLLTRILRHMASELNLNMRSDGYVKVQDLLNLNMKTFANVPLKSHTVDDIKEAVRRDNKQRFGLLDENEELMIRANQGHTIKTVESEGLLKPITLADEVLVCVHGTYKKNLESILEFGLKRMQRLHVHFACGLPTDGEVISGMRRDVNVLIYLDVKKALEDGMKLYISENRVILTEGFEGVVPVKYIEKIESWPDRRPIPFQT